MILLAGVLLAACCGCAVGETGSAGIVTDSGATVSGRVASTVGGQVEYWVEYGLTTSYGSETAHHTVATQQGTPVAVSVEIGGLARATRYHYRFCARDSQQTGGPGCGRDRTLTTQSFACGDTITASVRLTGSVACDGTGLVVGADGIDIENDVSGVALRSRSQEGRAGDGIFIGPFTAGTLLRDNRADHNQGDGIEVQASGARLGGNGATGNGDFGIDAATGVTDLGGNFASGNGNPLQCRNVFCS